MSSMTIGLILSILFFGFMFLGIPVSVSIAVSSFVIMVLMLPTLDMASLTASQSLVAGINNSALMAIPFFIFSGCIMNTSGLAIRLINFAKLFCFGFKGPLLFINVISNMLFGALSGSATAAAVAVGKVINPLEEKENYDPVLSTAVNIASCPTGLLIPPSNVIIVYALVSGGTSIAALFWAGYIPGILMGMAVMLVAGYFSYKNDYPKINKPTFRETITVVKEAVPVLLLIIITIGGITSGWFSATEASAVAVVYSIVLSIFYKTLTFHNFKNILEDTVLLSGVVLFLIACSSLMSWGLAYSGLPVMISNSILSLSDNKIIILLLINLLLLVVGMFMDMTPAILIFTPILLPIARELGIHDVHFGMIMIYNLSIGICTPPVGTALFVGCSINNTTIEQVSRILIPFFLMMFLFLMLITYIPELSLFLPRFVGFI